MGSRAASCERFPLLWWLQVRLYTILMEDVREIKEFVVKHCRVVSFSGGGQYFAFANNAQVSAEVPTAELDPAQASGATLYAPCPVPRRAQPVA